MADEPISPSQRLHCSHGPRKEVRPKIASLHKTKTLFASGVNHAWPYLPEKSFITKPENDLEKYILSSKHSCSHGKDFHRRLTGTVEFDYSLPQIHMLHI